MKPILVLLSLASIIPASAQVIDIEGHYQGNNIFVQNPFSNNGQGYCTKKVVVNGKEVPFTNASTFAIKLDSLGYKTGEKIKIEIHHQENCRPKVLHQFTHYPRPSFEVVSIGIDDKLILKWETKNETRELPFIIEQFRWNKWIKVGEVEGKGGTGQNEYTFKVLPHSGENLFRIKQLDQQGGSRVSQTVKLGASQPPPKLLSKKFYRKIEFSEETRYELYDSQGNILKTGSGKTINCSDLPRGMYFLNYDNVMTEVWNM